MDRFVVISFGKKVFHTRVIRHSLNPTWNEKFLFHVRRYEMSYKVQLTVFNWNKQSSTEHVGNAGFEVQDLAEERMQPNPQTGLYKFENEGNEEERRGGDEAVQVGVGDGRMLLGRRDSRTLFNFAQSTNIMKPFVNKQHLRQYDVDNINSISHLKFTSMFDSLRSALTRSTLVTFTRFIKNPKEDELTVNEAVTCLEAELNQ